MKEKHLLVFNSVFILFVVLFSMSMTAQKYTMICDCESGPKTNFNTYWFTFTDSRVNGGSVIYPSKASEGSFTVPGGRDGSANALKITYKLDKKNWKYDPFIGFGFALSKDGTPIDLSKSEGVEFWHKGAALTFSAKIQSPKKGNDYSFSVPKHDKWEKVTIRWKDLSQSQWGDKYPWDASKVTKFQWKVKGATGNTGEVYLDQIRVYEQ
jgi:licheninase